MPFIPSGDNDDDGDGVLDEDEDDEDSDDDGIPDDGEFPGKKSGEKKNYILHKINISTNNVSKNLN